MNFKLKTLILFVCSLIITMVPASAVQTGDFMANTDDIRKNQEDIDKDKNIISKARDEIESHSKIVQDTVNEMNDIKWYEFWRFDFFVREGPNILKSEGTIIESLSKNINDSSSDILQKGNELALNSESQKDSSDIGMDPYNNGDPKENAQVIAESLSENFKTKYNVKASDNLVRGDIVQLSLPHNDYVYLQYVGLNPSNDTALFLGDKNTAVRIPVNNMNITYKLTPETSTTNSADTTNSIDNLSDMNTSAETHIENAVTSPQISYIATIQKSGLKNIENRIYYCDKQIKEKEGNKKTGDNLDLAGRILIYIGTALFALGCILCHTVVAAIPGTIILAVATLLIFVGPILMFIGGLAFNTDIAPINALKNEKAECEENFNVIENNLNTYYDGKADNLPVSKDLALDIEENGNMTGSLNATDADADGIIYLLNHQASNGTVTLNQNGSYIYASNNNFTGNDSFTYTSNDIFGNSNIATVNINVHPVNHPPVSNNLTFNIETNNNLTGILNVTDADGDPITYNLVNSTSQGNITINANGTFDYSPSDGFVGNDSFTYASNDWKETGNIATVQIHVHPVNHVPVANDIDLTMNKNENIAGNITATDEDGDPLSYNIKNKPLNGKLILNSDGSFTYTPNRGFIGIDIFTYSAKDWKDTSEIGTVKIEVQDVNHAPVVQNMNLTTTINKTLNSQFKATDLDGDKQTFKVVKTTSHGTLKINGTQFTYTPTKNFNGTDSFTYKSNDGTSDSNIGRITIIVTKTPIKVINMPLTTVETPTKMVTNTASTIKTSNYTPKNTLNPLTQKTPKLDTESQIPNPISKTKNTTDTNQTQDITKSSQNTMIEFILSAIQNATNYITGLNKK
jgi:VCBS repeat-containing protein